MTRPPTKAALLVAHELAGLGIDEVNALARSAFHRLEVLALILARLLRGITMHSEPGNWAAINESQHGASRRRQMIAIEAPHPWLVCLRWRKFCITWRLAKSIEAAN